MHHIYAIAFLLVLCCFLGYSMGRIYGFTILPDEFGYWSHAAAIAGYDWSGIASLNSYYSYGYSAILLPVLMLFQDGLMAYRTAVMVNFVMLAGIGLMLQYLAGKIFPNGKQKRMSAIAAVAALYPTLLLYARTTMAETMLAFLYILTVVLLYQYLERRNVSILFLLLGVLVYIYFVHMRTVSMLVAGVLTALFGKLMFRGDAEDNRRHHDRLLYALVVAAAVVLFVVGMAARNLIFDHVYGGDPEIYQVNDYRGQFGKLQYIVTPEGIGNLMISIAGKVLYLGSATFGTAFWGLWHAWKDVRYGREKKKRIFWCFVLLSAAGALMVNAIYTVYPGRVDALAYGRYHEYVFPILMLAGLYEMCQTRRVWKGMLWNAGLELCMLMPVLYSLYQYHQTSLHACMVFGMSYLYDAGDSDPVKFYLKACGFSILLMAIVTVLIVIGRKRESQMPVVFLIAVMEVFLALRASAVVTDAGSIGTYRDSVIADRITELKDNDITDEKGQPVRRVLYLDGNGDSSIGVIQFLLRDTQITVLDHREYIEDYREDEMGIWDLVLIDYRDDYGGELCKKYDYTLSSGHFILYYNRF